MASFPDSDPTEDASDLPPAIKWTPLRMLHMEYPEGDKIGHVLAWFSMTPFFIFAGMVTLILFRRDLHTIAFTLGQLVNEVFNLILKRIIKGMAQVCLCGLTNLKSSLRRYSTFRANPVKTGGLIFVTLISFPKLHFLHQT